MSFPSFPRVGIALLLLLIATSYICSSQANAPNVVDMVHKAIQENKVMIFSKSYCPHCKKTKKLFSGMGIKPTVFEIDRHEDGPEVQSALQSLTGQRTVPNVFINGIHVGGNDDTQRALSSGELQKLLNGDL